MRKFLFYIYRVNLIILENWVGEKIRDTLLIIQCTNTQTCLSFIASWINVPFVSEIEPSVEGKLVKVQKRMAILESVYEIRTHPSNDGRLGASPPQRIKLSSRGILEMMPDIRVCLKCIYLRYILLRISNNMKRN